MTLGKRRRNRILLLGILVAAGLAVVVGAAAFDNWLRTLPGGNDVCYGKPTLSAVYDVQVTEDQVDAVLAEVGWESGKLWVNETADNQTARRVAAMANVITPGDRIILRFSYVPAGVHPKVPEESEEYLGPIIAPTLEHLEATWGPPIRMQYEPC